MFVSTKEEDARHGGSRSLKGCWQVPSSQRTRLADCTFSVGVQANDGQWEGNGESRHVHTLTVWEEQCSSQKPHPTVCSLSLHDPVTAAHRLSCAWEFSGKNTGVGCDFLLQGIFATQGSTLCLWDWHIYSIDIKYCNTYVIHNTYALFNT